MKVPLLLANIQIVLLIRKLDHMAADQNPEPFGAGSILGFFFGVQFFGRVQLLVELCLSNDGVAADSPRQMPPA
jgi:hypothetical protein